MTHSIAIGITTAPRRDSLLAECCRSLTLAGGEFTVFAEPGTDLSAIGAAARVVQRTERLGAWHNWRTMCRELLDRDRSPMILTVQDDTVFSRDSINTLLDLWPTQSNVGFVSLYTPSHYQRKWYVERSGRTLAIRADSQSAVKVARRHSGSRVVFREYPLGVYKVGTRSLWGACALAFPRDVLARVIDHRIAKSWKGASPKRKRSESPAVFRARLARFRQRPAEQIANVDTVIGQILNALRLQMLFVNPSLTQHAAHHSTLGHGGLGGRRQAWRVADDLVAIVPGSISASTASTSTKCCDQS